MSLAKLFTLMFTLITLTNHQKHQPQKRKAGKVTRGSFPKAGHENNDTKLPDDGQVGGEGEHVQHVQEELDGESAAFLPKVLKINSAQVRSTNRQT